MTKKDVINLYTEAFLINKFQNRDYFLNSESQSSYSYSFFAIISAYYFYKLGFKGTYPDYFKSTHFKESLLSFNTLLPSFKNFVELTSVKKNTWARDLKVATKDITIIGDSHPRISKVSISDSVYTRDTLHFADFWTNLVELLPEISVFFPSYIKNGGVVSRQYIGVDTNVTDFKQYYFNFGVLTSVCLFLKMIDLNHENILIKMGNTPFVFDTEFTFSPKFKSTAYSIKISGLLNGQAVDNNSSLFGGLFDINSYLEPLVELDVNSHPNIKWVIPSKRLINNLPSGENIHPHLFIKEILKGYDFGTNLINNKEKMIYNLIYSTDLCTRLLIRPTRVYRYLLLKYFYPQIHLKIKSDEFFNKNLKEKAPFLFDLNNFESIISAEVQDLNNLEIPYFYSPIHSKDIIHPNKGIVGALNKTPFDEWLYVYKNFDSFMQTQRKKIEILSELNYSKWLKSKKKNSL